MPAKERLVADWWEAAEKDLPGVVMLARRREDVRDLNAAARARMLAAGRLGADAVVVGGREFRVGDRVVCRRNDTRLGVRNGARGRVAAVDASGRVTLETDAEELRHLPAAYAVRDLEHGYALTGHCAQGATVERAFVLMSDSGALRDWAYVAGSRARGETRVYATGRALSADALASRHAAPLDSRLAAALSRSDDASAAADMRTRAAGLEL